MNFPHLLDITPSPPSLPWSQTNILEEKVSLIAFRQILTKILTATYFFSSTIMTNFKKVIGYKSLNPKQYPGGLSPRIIPLNLYGKSWGWGRIPANSQKFTNFPIRKNPPWYIFISHYQKCHSFYIKEQFSFHHPMQALFVAVVIAVVSFF